MKIRITDVMVQIAVLGVWIAALVYINFPFLLFLQREKAETRLNLCPLASKSYVVSA